MYLQLRSSHLWWEWLYSRVPNSSPDPNNRPGRTNFLKINKCPGVLFSKNDPNKSVLDRKLSKINKNILPHYLELKSNNGFLFKPIVQ